METKFYCSKCGFSLKVAEVKDFSIPNFTELRIMIRPCTECAAQQSAQADMGTFPKSGEYFVEYVESNVMRLTPRR